MSGAALASLTDAVLAERSDRAGQHRGRALLGRRRLGGARRRARRCRAARERWSRSTSTTGCAPTPTRTRARAPSSAIGSASSWSCERPRSPARATSRPRRATRATRPPSGCGASAGLDWIATGHTRTDLAETVLYRLATSPGPPGAARPAAAPRASVVRPLLALGRDRVAGAGRARPASPSATTRPTPSPRYARNRIRNEVLPGAARDRPGAEDDDRRDPAPSWPRRPRRSSGSPPRRSRPPARPPPARSRRRRSTALDPALRRLALRALAERVARAPGPARPRAGGARSPASPRSPRAGWWSSAAASRPRSSTATSASRCRPRVAPERGDPDRPRELPLRQLGGPRRAAARARSSGERPRRGRASTRARSAETLVVRSWRDGDRIRPLGLGRDASRSRTCSPTARCRARCGGRCRWSPRAGGSPGSPASRSPRSSPPSPAAAERGGRSSAPPRRLPRLPPVEGDELIGEVLVSEEDLQRRVTELAARGQPRLRGARRRCWSRS